MWTKRLRLFGNDYENNNNNNNNKALGGQEHYCGRMLGNRVSAAPKSRAKWDKTGSSEQHSVCETF